MRQVTALFQIEVKHMLVSDKTEIDGVSAKILHPDCRTLFRYWESLRAERPSPRKDEIDLSSIAAIVPFLTIIERISGANPWRFRLAGTKVCEIFGQNMTHADALLGWDKFERTVVGNCLELSITRLQPSLMRMRFVSQQTNVLAAEMIGLPLQNGPHGPVHILGGIFSFSDDKSRQSSSYSQRELVSARMIWTEHGVGDQLLEAIGRKSPVQLHVIQGGLR
jgi:hypothetical protein